MKDYDCHAQHSMLFTYKFYEHAFATFFYVKNGIRLFQKIFAICEHQCMMDASVHVCWRCLEKDLNTL